MKFGRRGGELLQRQPSCALPGPATSDVVEIPQLLQQVKTTAHHYLKRLPQVERWLYRPRPQL